MENKLEKIARELERASDFYAAYTIREAIGEIRRLREKLEFFETEIENDR